jgi:hypothetical protein
MNAEPFDDKDGWGPWAATTLPGLAFLGIGVSVAVDAVTGWPGVALLAVLGAVWLLSAASVRGAEA